MFNYFRQCREYHEPLDVASLQRLMRKNFASETMKKITWVFNMFQDWRNYRNSLGKFSNIACDLSDITSITEESLKFALCRFLTEVKKLDGSEFPPKTLYDIVMCVSSSWKLKVLHGDLYQMINFMK